MNPLGSLPHVGGGRPAAFAGAAQPAARAGMGLPRTGRGTRNGHRAAARQQADGGQGDLGRSACCEKRRGLEPGVQGQRAPLVLLLAEGQQQFEGNNATPIRLGEVGGRIIAEVMIGLLLGDSHSFLVQDPGWTPVKQSFAWRT